MKPSTVPIILSLLLTSGPSMGAEKWIDSLRDKGVEFHGFIDCRSGRRLHSDPLEESSSLNEIRLQIDSIWYHDTFTAQIKTDFLYDHSSSYYDNIHLETGSGWIDLRQASLMTSPLPWMDIKLGRQIITWGTGDLLFINDLFPKDWQSFFLGRDDEYLKAPSDAMLISLFPEIVSINIAYTPRFDSDRHITGERISYWNGSRIAGRDSILDTERRERWIDDDEIALRAYRHFGPLESALYFYNGFWKSPGGIDSSTGTWIFPELSVYGASVQGPIADGIGKLETGYYDSTGDRDGKDPFINNSEIRFLAGYEQEIIRNLTFSMQYYVEYMMHHDEYITSLREASMPTTYAREEDRHTLTFRITWLLMNQNLILNCFTRFSPSDEDVYIKPSASYKLSDRWQVSLGGNVFAGKEKHTFLGQFEDNSNIHASLRYNY